MTLDEILQGGEEAGQADSGEECSKQNKQPGQPQKEQVNSRRMISEVSGGYRPRGPHGPLDTFRFYIECNGEVQQTQDLTVA